MNYIQYSLHSSWTTLNIFLFVFQYFKSSVLYTHNTYANICGNKVNNNDDFNERANTLLYKNISLTLYSRKGWCWLCVRGELQTGTNCYILTPSSSDHSSTSFSSWLGLLNRGSLRAQSPLSAAGSHAGILSPTNSNSNWLKASMSWLYFCLTSACFRCSSAYLHRCISWLTARSRVNMLHLFTGEGITKEQSFRSWYLVSVTNAYKWVKK